MKGKCGHSTDRLYKLPDGNDWLCADCILDNCDMVHAGHLEQWTIDQLNQEGVRKEDKE
jgi:hypothetical protein